MGRFRHSIGSVALAVSMAAVAGCDGDDTVSPGTTTQSGTPSGSGGAGAAGGSGGSAGQGGTDPCADHCANNVVDCGETDVDCGGGGCPTCDQPFVWFGNAYQTPHVAVHAPDRVMVVWADVDASLMPIHSSCYDGSNWSSAAAVYASHAPSEYPRVAAAPDGTFHLLNIDGLALGSRIRHARHAGPGCASGWEDGGMIDSLTYTCYPSSPGCLRSGWPNLEVDEANNPWAQWTEDDFTMIHFSRWTGSAWTDPVDLAETHGTDQSAVGDIAVAGSTGYVVWQEGHVNPPWQSERRLMFREGDGSSWSSHLVLADESLGYFRHPQLDANLAGNVYVVGTVGTRAVLRARLGGTWQTEWQDLSTTVPDNSWASIKVDEAGALHAAWIEDGDPNQVVYALGDAATGTFQPARQASEATVDCFDPVIDTDAEGYAHLVWVEDTPPADDEGQVVYAKVRYQDL